MSMPTTSTKPSVWRGHALVAAALFTWSGTTALAESKATRQSDANRAAIDYRYYSLYLNTNSRFIDIASASYADIRKASKRSNAESVREHVARTKAHAQNVHQQLRADFQNRRCGDPELAAPRVALFVHGGLNTIRTGLKNIEYRVQQMLAACYQPVFINWRSGLLSSYWESLKKWSPDTGGRGSVWNVPAKFPVDTLSMVVEAPQNWGLEAYHGISSIRRSPRKMGLNKEELRNSVYYEQISIPPDTNQRGYSNRAAIWWLTAPAKVLSTPVVGKFGARAWDEMRNRALSITTVPAHATDGELSDEFGSAPSICDAQDHSVVQQPGNRIVPAEANCAPRGVAAIFLRELSRLLSHSYPDHELTLIGHSMGSIVVNDLVTALPELQVRNVVHMASADTVERVRSVQTAFLSRHSKRRAFNLYLHPDNESRETRVKGIAPSGSLLVWIDNMLANPTVLGERMAGRWDNSAQAIFEYPASVADRVYHRIFTAKPPKGERRSADPKKCSPIDHGGFSDCPFWDQSFWFDRPLAY